MTTVKQEKKQHKNDPKQLLGAWIKSFPNSRRLFYRWILLLTGVFLATLASVISIIQFINLLIAINNHGRAIVISQAPSIIFSLCAVLPMGIFLSLLGIIHWNDAVKLYENGIIKVNGIYKKHWLWRDTKSLNSTIKHINFAGSTIAVSQKLDLINNQYGLLKIRDRYKESPELVSSIRSQVIPILYQRAVHQMKNREKIKFHSNLYALFYGIQIKESVFPWGEIQTITTRNGMFELRSKLDQKILFRKNHKRINNIDLLRQLISDPPTNTANS